MRTAAGSIAAAVDQAIATVDDPEYPGISIVDLGLVETIDIDDATARIGLIPTFSGCPALALIADDVTRAVNAVPGIANTQVVWLRSPNWTADRVSAVAKQALAIDFTVAVRIGPDEPSCPRCGGDTSPRSPFGPSRCRSISMCESCRETVEVMRR